MRKKCFNCNINRNISLVSIVFIFAVNNTIIFVTYNLLQNTNYYILYYSHYNFLT